MTRGACRRGGRFFVAHGRAAQLGLFEAAVAELRAETITIDAAFVRFHSDNPRVYRRLVALARKAKRRGARRLGMKMLFELLRWDHLLKTSGEPFKLCNSYTSRYARLIMDQEPDLDGIFSTRALTSD